MMRPIAAVLLVFLFAVPLTAGTTYFAQVADGGGYITAFTIMNPTASAAIGTVRLKDANGNSWSITLADGRSGSQFTFTIPAMGSARLVSTGVGQVKTGWAVLDSTADLSGVETFLYQPGSSLQDSVGVVGTPAGKRFVIPVDTSSTTDTGFGIVNAGTTDTAVRLTLKSEDGSTYASLTDSRLNPLASQKYFCLFVSQIFPILQSGTFKGALLIESSGDIGAVGLAYKEGQLSSIPIAALASQTEGGIINGIRVPPDPGAAGTATVNGIDTDGNGIRDEIDRFIATKYGLNPTALAAARQSARARQRVLTSDPSNKTAARVTLQDSGDAGICAGRAFVSAGLKPAEELQEIYLRTYNTLARLAKFKSVAGAAGQFTRSITSVVCSQ
jgi:hypothetical protein